MAKAGEFFVNMGIKGSEKTNSQLRQTTDGFADLKKMSVETKGAILAALYVLEKIVATSGQLGTTLKNFGAVSGIAPEVLERYQYAAKKAGVENDSLLQSFLKLQGTAFDVRAGKGLPPWMSSIITSLAQHGVNVGSDWAARWQQDPTIALQAMQKFAQLKDIDTSTRSIVLQQAGFAPDLVAALMRGALTPGKLAEVPSMAILNQEQVTNLDKMRQAWDNLGSYVAGGWNKGLAGFLKYSSMAGEGLMVENPNAPHHVIHHHKTEVHQQINVHGNADPSKIKKAAHDGAAEALTANTYSAQTSH